MFQNDTNAFAGRALSNWRDPKSYFGRVFNFKLDSFVSCQNKYIAFILPIIDSKTEHRLHPVNCNLSISFVRSQTFLKLNFGAIYVALGTSSMYLLNRWVVRVSEYRGGLGINIRGRNNAYLFSS